jgi:hypothetical protein
MTLREPMPAGHIPSYPYVWWWRFRLPERKGQRCRVTARGALNSIRVEFADGFWVITSRWAVRLATAVRTNPIHRQPLRRARPAVRRSNELRSRA